MSAFGKLQKLPLGTRWSNESSEFTPWLAEPENLDLLATAIQTKLKLVGTEIYVGPFRADVVCNNETTNSRVIIENQLFQSDHKHLGQLMTYAAGLDAGAIVWVAAGFSKEHCAAIEWLNDTTKEKTQFFAVAIELFRIDNSLPEPKFTVVCAPNEWRRSIKRDSIHRERDNGAEYTFAGDYIECIELLNSQGTTHLKFLDGCTVIETLAEVERIGGRQVISEANKELAKIGLRIVVAQSRLKLAIANNHPVLERIFSETRWADGRWRGLFINMMGAKVCNPRSFANQRSCAVEMPLSEFLAHAQGLEEGKQ